VLRRPVETARQFGTLRDARKTLDEWQEDYNWRTWPQWNSCTEKRWTRWRP